MSIALKPYQKYGAKWLASRKVALLADRPRLGKSAQAITACDMLGATKIVVLCMGVARHNWRREFEIFGQGSRNFYTVFGKDPIPPLSPPYVVICNYENLDSLLASSVSDCDVLISDESHALKNIEAQRTQKVLGTKGLIRRAKRTWLLTGTPTPNNYSEFWPILFVFGVTKLPFDQFVRRYCEVKHNAYGFQIIGSNKDPERIKELQEMLSKIMLRRTEEDVQLELPKMSFSTVIVEPGRVHLEMSKTFIRYTIPIDRTDELKKMLEEQWGIIDGITQDRIMSDEVMAVLKAEAKSISTLRRYAALQKLENACKLIAEELKNNAYQKCVIFAVHQDAIEGARVYLKEFHPVTLYGGSNPHKAENNIRKFQDPKSNVRVFIGNIQAAGTSIKLDAANHIFFLEESWVPGENIQAAMRCGGMNQTKPIFVRNFCLNNGIDQRVQELLRTKMNDLALIYDTKPQPQNESLTDLL